MSEKFRDFLKSSCWKTIDFSTTEQAKGIKPPPAEKPCNPEDRRIDLVKPGEWQSIRKVSVEAAITQRKSIRVYSEDAIKLEELSFLLWATQGVREKKSEDRNYRTVPSGGCRHALETYIAAFRVEGIPKAIYRYLPLSHQLVEVVKYQDLEGLIIKATLDQSFAGKSAVTFIWTTLPARTEWRYDRASCKLIALDAGHVCQNLYLACEAIGAGTCAIAKYDQEFADKILGINGVEEFTIYMASVGKVQ
jgi:SagB-type dehydrogenase family enzyme